MTVRSLLGRQARLLGRRRAGRLAGRLVLLGGTFIAAALFLERAGIGAPFLRLPGVPAAEGTADRLLGYLAVSFAGLLQGAALLTAVFLAALVVRLAGAALLRPRAARVAADLDRVLGTDRFASALEARGPLAPLVAHAVLAQPPPDDTLCRERSRFWRRWARRLVLALVLLVALAPGTAPGDKGAAFVAGTPEGGVAEEPLDLKLVWDKKLFGPKEPVPVQVIAEAASAPRTDLDLPVRIVIDDRPEIETGAALFLPAGAPGQDAVTLDLRALADRLEPGEHRAVARAGDEESNAYLFRIEASGDGGGGSPPPPQPSPSQAAGAGGAGPEKVKPKFVQPLVREGEDRKVVKVAKVPIEVRGGGAPAERSLEEAWPELERRKEAALNRPGLSPTARRLVREYFERLRPEGRR
ncbi:MAG: hypothetical protein ACYTEZ_01020 [Planctomycetota bacterium]|jgi:hypothetical protein